MDERGLRRVPARGPRRRARTECCRRSPRRRGARASARASAAVAPAAPTFGRTDTGTAKSTMAEARNRVLRRRVDGCVVEALDAVAVDEDRETADHRRRERQRDALCSRAHAPIASRSSTARVASSASSSLSETPACARTAKPSLPRGCRRARAPRRTPHDLGAEGRAPDRDQTLDLPEAHRRQRDVSPAATQPRFSRYARRDFTDGPTPRLS